MNQRFTVSVAGLFSLMAAGCGGGSTPPLRSERRYIALMKKLGLGNEIERNSLATALC
jgi:hypothetical protein